MFVFFLTVSSLMCSFFLWNKTILVSLAWYLVRWYFWIYWLNVFLYGLMRLLFAKRWRLGSLDLFFGFSFCFLVDGLDVVKENDPTNNVPDTIFSKLGVELHRRDNHPIGILKNAIYDYFDTNFPAKFVKFDDLCPIVPVKQVSRNYFYGYLQNLIQDPKIVFVLLYRVKICSHKYVGG